MAGSHLPLLQHIPQALTISSPHLVPVGTSLRLATISLPSLLSRAALHLNWPKERVKKPLPRTGLVVSLTHSRVPHFTSLSAEQL